MNCGIIHGNDAVVGECWHKVVDDPSIKSLCIDCGSSDVIKWIETAPQGEGLSQAVPPSHWFYPSWFSPSLPRHESQNNDLLDEKHP
jgi:hypothetical protein